MSKTATLQTTSRAASSPSSGPLLQRACACGGAAGVSGECEECNTKKLLGKPLQRKLAVSQPGDEFEEEADRVAEQVMRMPDAELNRQHRDIGTPLIQRRAPSSDTGVMEAPPIVHNVLNSPGQPLDAATRTFFEPRFGYDFGRVRVHADTKAAESAKAVNALAYTVGHDLVFGAGRYAPKAGQGKRLMAHELTHVIQQGHRDLTAIELQPESAGETSLQRACLPSADCAGPRATLTEFVEETEKKPENISKADKRQKACTKVPRDPSCTSDGHGATATALTALLKVNYASRLGYITGIYVHKDMPATWGAVTNDCANFMPPLPGGKCTFVPDRLEAQAKLYQGGAKTVGGRPRQNWLTQTIGTLTHETEHARFDTAAPIPEPSPAACKFSDHESNLSEMAAHLSEMHVFYREALARPRADRFKRFYKMFDFWVKNGSEDISGIVKDLRCRCECADANYFIAKTVESVSTNQKWDSNERFMIHTELREPKWALNWPVAPPASVDIGDLPTEAAAPLKFE